MGGFATLPARRGSGALARAAVLCAALAAANAVQAGAAPVDIRHHLPDLSLDMQAENGVRLDAQAWRGKIVLLYFGYTRCRDVCPDTLARIGAALERLGAQGAGVRTLFVSVDPRHDTAAALRAYLAAFPAARATGLRGDDAATLALVKRCRAAYRPAGDGADGEPVHGAAVYVFDRSGRARALVPAGAGPDAIAATLRALLAEAP